MAREVVWRGILFARLVWRKHEWVYGLNKAVRMDCRTAWQVACLVHPRKIVTRR